jgi:hypothetical protein
MGDSRAMALPARERMYSSPLSTSASILERLVFASWVLTVFMK